ncbi:hypothetical protein ACWD00_40745 [Streptomyces viridiviolaceus]
MPTLVREVPDVAGAGFGDAQSGVEKDGHHGAVERGAVAGCGQELGAFGLVGAEGL